MALKQSYIFSKSVILVTKKQSLQYKDQNVKTVCY